MNPTASLKPLVATVLALGAVGLFHTAFLFPALGWLAVGHLGCLFELRRLPTPRQAFYTGMAIGIAVYVPQMIFLWEIFHGAAIPLWCVLSLFHAAFLLMLNRVENRWGSSSAGLLMPVLWCGIEYLRSEVWWLRFAWFTAGGCWPAGAAPLVLQRLGIYGLGFGMAWAAAQGVTLIRAPDRDSRRRAAVALSGICALFLGTALWPSRRDVADVQRVPVAGIQLEFPAVPDLLQGLDGLIRSHPEAELLMVSEYTLEGSPTQALKNWCQRNHKWLVVGGKQPIAGAPTGAAPGSDAALAPTLLSAPRLPWRRSDPTKERFHNTAFVIGTNGQVVFQQAKSRPIPFFDDGEAAASQAVWNSPWGRLGIAICYDASYRQVMDGLIRQGAVGLLIPTMDVEHWGAHEHGLNAGMAVIRAAEYGVPVFRIASSGISQLIDRNGRETATAPFPGQGELLAGTFELRPSGGTIPPDAGLAPACMVATGGVLLALGIGAWRTRRVRRHSPASPADRDAVGRPKESMGSPWATSDGDGSNGG